jgi:hypothetical protein
VEYLIDISDALQQLAAALAALPHNYDEGAQRVQAAMNVLAGIEADAERQLDAMYAYYEATQATEPTALVEGVQ